MKEFKINTERLTICQFEKSMIESVYKNSLDEDTQKYIPDEVYNTVEEAEETVNFLINCYKTQDGPLVYPILLNSGENIGYIQAIPISHDEYEIGYHIAKAFTNHGYATEAMKAFLPVILKSLNIDYIWGICHGENIASCKVLEKCNFKLIKKSTGNYQGKECVVCKYLFKY